MQKARKIKKSFGNKLRFCPLCRYYLHSIRIDGRNRLVCEKCGWVHYRNPVPVALCVAKNKENKILAAKRNTPPRKDEWALPGGFVESGETPEAACLRELKEETGLKGRIKKLAGIHIQRSADYGWLLVIGYEIAVSKNTLSLNSELKEARFFSKKEMPFIPFLSHRKIIEKV